MAGIQSHKDGDTMEDFLRKIASETENTIRNDAKKAQFLKSIEAYREMREKFLQALQQCKNEAVENQLFHDENAAELPISKEKREQGWELEEDYLIEIPAQPRNIYRAFWRSPLPFDPDAWIMHHYGSPFYNSIVATPRIPKEPKEPDNAEHLICEYVVLAVIHDCLWEKPKSQKLIEVDDSNWVVSLWNSIKWFRQLNGDDYKNRIHNINQSLKNVKTDLPKPPAETGQIGCPTSNITTKDIDKLLELFRQLENLLNPELPQRDGQLWVKAMEQSRKELADKLKKRQSGFTLRPGRNNLKRKSIKAGHSKKEEQAERIIRQMAENKYRLWDSKYDQSLSQVEEKIVEVVKRIDHTLYSMKEPLLAFDRTQGTLLQANFRNIRDDFTVNEIRQFQDMVNKSIDALEAIRLKVERQQRLEAPIKNQVSPNKKNAKTTFAAIIISLFVICIFLLSVWLIPFTPFAWLKNHPNSYPLQGGIICLITCVFVGLFKPKWRKACWGSAVAFVVLILSLA